MKTLNKAVARYNGIQPDRSHPDRSGSSVRCWLCGPPGAGWVGELGSLLVAPQGHRPGAGDSDRGKCSGTGLFSKLDRRFGTVIWLYMLTTFLAAAIAVVTSFMFPVTGRAGRRCPVRTDVVPQGLSEVMVTNFVANPVSAIMSGNIGILFLGLHLAWP